MKTFSKWRKLPNVELFKIFVENHPEKALFALGLIFSLVVFLTYSLFLNGTVWGVILFGAAVVACLLVLDALRQQDKLLAEILGGIMLLILVLACLRSPLLYLNRSPLRCFYDGKATVIITFKQILNTLIFMWVSFVLTWVLYDLAVLFWNSRSPIYKGYDFYKFKSTPQFEPRNAGAGIIMKPESPKNQGENPTNQTENVNQNAAIQPQDFPTGGVPQKAFVEAKVTEISFDEKLRKNFNKRFN